jgi:hypothetical protein
MLVYDFFETALLLGFFKILCYFCKKKSIHLHFYWARFTIAEFQGPLKPIPTTGIPSKDSGRKTLNPSVDASRDSRRPPSPAVYNPPAHPAHLAFFPPPQESSQGASPSASTPAPNHPELASDLLTPPPLSRRRRHVPRGPQPRLQSAASREQLRRPPGEIELSRALLNGCSLVAR